jgi:hypothetical protein
MLVLRGGNSWRPRARASRWVPSARAGRPTRRRVVAGALTVVIRDGGTLSARRAASSRARSPGARRGCRGGPPASPVTAHDTSPTEMAPRSTGAGHRARRQSGFLERQLVDRRSPRQRTFRTPLWRTCGVGPFHARTPGPCRADEPSDGPGRRAVAARALKLFPAAPSAGLRATFLLAEAAADGSWEPSALTESQRSADACTPAPGGIRVPRCRRETSASPRSRF